MFRNVLAMLGLAFSTPTLVAIADANPSQRVGDRVPPPPIVGSPDKPRYLRSSVTCGSQAKPIPFFYSDAVDLNRAAFVCNEALRIARLCFNGSCAVPGMEEVREWNLLPLIKASQIESIEVVAPHSPILVSFGHRDDVGLLFAVEFDQGGGHKERWSTIVP